MNSIDYPPPSLVICPFRRYSVKIRKFKTTEISGSSFFIIDNSYHISDSDDAEDETHQLRLFLGCNNEEDEHYCSACYKGDYKSGTTYYFCNKCKNYYHKECVESPPIFFSPCHPKNPLQLLYFIFDVTTIYYDKECHACGLKIRGLCYYSFTCDLWLDPVCARKREFSAINNPKRHEHMLHYFPRKASLTCDVCALDDSKYCFYSCLQCDFIVHRTCIYLPRVIQISYHIHRLSFTLSLPFQNLFCGVCRRKINENYGEYSCTKGCVYAVHSKCATRPDIWDGKELEDQPEMLDDNIKSFEEIDDGIIRHFSHAHHLMRLHENMERFFDGEQNCQACILPLDDGNVYRCMQCDFVFHEACANLPRFKYNMVHPHRLILRPIDKYFFCDICYRYSCGFSYMCSEGCPSNEFYPVDIRCASFSEVVDHPSHPHPLFLIYDWKTAQACSICRTKSIFIRSLSCAECDFSLCFRCATLPYKVKHKDDEHILSLCYEKNASGLYWCQVCEKTTNPKKGYYTCNECGVTFHIKCILGEDPYMKAGTINEDCSQKVEVIPNNRLSRPICNKCQRRCRYKIVFKTSNGNMICSAREVDGLRVYRVGYVGFLDFLKKRMKEEKESSWP
ncbi:DC1 [Arabidopsis suecica]|uniref:DC1 n=1 Tax=Arabidopsis suecica TaxID=45249 RepID=A0A8T1YMZ7_ARASU|nr:DC1 [Arabidopsis suecica]